MILAKVISRVVSTAKLDSLPARPLLSVEPLPLFRDSKEAQAIPLIAIDTVEAGPGDTVLVLQEGAGARQAALPPDQADTPLPAQAVVVGIVDAIQISKRVVP